MAIKNSKAGSHHEEDSKPQGQLNLQQQSKLQDHELPELAQRFLWADSPPAVARLISGLSIVCVVLFLLDLVIDRHANVPGEAVWGFHAIVGFIAFTVIVLAAKQLRRWVLRDEKYYAPNSIDAEPYPDAGLDRQSHAPSQARGEHQQ